VIELKQEKLSSNDYILRTKKQFLSQYKHVLPEKERIKLIREINQLMKDMGLKQ
tara:strand:+ start:484 stop:645 length:162 start_codon:yes stop_codon:yes gene_type:complete